MRWRRRRARREPRVPTASPAVKYINVVHYLPTVNAALNATATVLLLIGWLLIKQRRETAHKRVMLTAFGVSVAFLTCYVIYHVQVGSVKFTGPPPVRQIYLTILVTHVALAVMVPFLAGRTIYLGLRDRRAEHRRAAHWTFPIWLYVSVTGVFIYVMLYFVYPAAKSGDTMGPATSAEVRQPSEP